MLISKQILKRFAPPVSLAAGLALAAPAAADTHLYRYSVGTPYAFSRYVGELASASPPGGYDRVETDAGGRIVRIDYLRNGSLVSSSVYQYAGATTAPFRSDTQQDGQPTGYSTYQYYAGGTIQRSDSFTTLGALTSYVTCTPLSQQEIDCSDYSKDGAITGQRNLYYDGGSRLVRAKSWIAGANSYHLATYDPTDGLETENDVKLFAGDQVVNISKLTYDSNGDRSRRDGYDGKTGQWFASIEFNDNLPVKKSYKYTDGQTYVSEHHYNDKKWWTGSDIYVNGALLFRFVYPRQPDGTVIKTQALGLNGDLWAEYPDVSIDEVDHTGHLSTNPSLGVIYKQGAWW